MANRVFAYLIATTEVSANLAESEFGSTDMRPDRSLAPTFFVYDLINNNPYLVCLAGPNKGELGSLAGCSTEVLGNPILQLQATHSQPRLRPKQGKTFREASAARHCVEQAI